MLSILKRNLPLLLIVALFGYTSCVKEIGYDDVPAIEFVSMNENAFLSGQPDSLIITFSFTDGDGDLGSEDSINIFVEDSRVPGSLLPYKIPFIEQKGRVDDISGEIQLTLLSSSCIPTGNLIMDTMQYIISIRDRAGNESDPIVTPDIYLECM